MIKKSLFIALLLLIFVTQNILSQHDLLNSEYKYYLGTSEPANLWATNDFDDSEWLLGTGTIGYGDTINRTVTASVSSIYVRYSFYISAEDTINIEALSANINFDDAFIAYLNGYEFARVNLGRKGFSPKHNTLSDRSHESNLSTGNYKLVSGYYINKANLKNHLIIGENIIAIEVHNDSISGSDLSLNCNLNPIYYEEYPNSFSYLSELRTKTCVELDSSKLPIVIINSDEFGIPVSHIEVPANMGVITSATGEYNKPDDVFNEYNGRIKIEIRGQSSSLFPKVSFNIETQNSDGSNNNVPLLDLPVENDWILYGPFADKTLIMNQFIFALGEKQGYYESRMKSCELILNGEYMGLYFLMEKIKPDKNRLNISKLTSDDLYDDDVTGGYIFHTNTRDDLSILYPKETKIQEEQVQYLENYLNNFHNLLYSDKWLDPQIGYRKYIDTESLLDFFIINELAAVLDKYEGSTFMYKDRNDKDSIIKYGPLWDFNYAMGNNSASVTDAWVFHNMDLGYKRYFQDTALVNQLNVKWINQRNSFLHVDSIFALIDSLSGCISESREKNYKIWPYINRAILFNEGNDVENYELAISNLKSWLQTRLTWMDNNIGEIYYPLESSSEIDFGELIDQKISVYPNPFAEFLNIELPVNSFENTQVEILNAQGVLIKKLSNKTKSDGKAYYTWTEIPESLTAGIYFINVISDGVLLGSTKVLKKN